MKGKDDARQKQKDQRNSLSLETLSYLCCHSVHWYLVYLQVLEVLWALGLPSHQRILPNGKMVRRQNTNIKKVILIRHTSTFFFFYLEVLSLLPALVAPSLPGDLKGLFLVGNTRRN